jgi:hypothetical protein
MMNAAAIPAAIRPCSSEIAPASHFANRFVSSSMSSPLMLAATTPITCPNAVSSLKGQLDRKNRSNVLNDLLLASGTWSSIRVAHGPGLAGVRDSRFNLSGAGLPGDTNLPKRPAAW